MKTLLFWFTYSITAVSIIVVFAAAPLMSCNDPRRPIAIVTNGDTTLVSPVDDSLYIKLHCKYDSLEN